MEKWMLFTILYALFSGFFGSAQKKALTKSSMYEVLTGFCTIGFIIVAIISRDVFNIELAYLPIIFLKSLIIVIAWWLGMYVISRMQISLYEIIKLSTIIFTVTMGCIIFKEVITFKMIIGMIIVLIGLIIVNLVSDKNNGKDISLKLIIIMLVSCFLNAVSSIIDKAILTHITSSQLQFWFLFFLMIIYWGILIISRKKIDLKKIKKNYWIIIIAICITVGDRFLFIANSIEESKVSIMTILKQISVIETIFLGKILFNEKNILKKLICSLFIIFGIALIVI